MRWTEDGRIQVTRNFALGAAGVIIVLALVMMLLIGMLISGNGDAEPGSTIDPTPSVMAAEQETETPSVMATEQETDPPTSDLRTVDQEDATETPARPQTGTKTEYSTCLLRTQKSLLLDIEDARFTPWPDYGDNRSVWDIIRYRYVDYIGEHCRNVAPAPPSTYSETCIPRELQSFYRRHIPEGADNENLRALAAEYALAVCQPSAER